MAKVGAFFFSLPPTHPGSFAWYGGIHVVVYPWTVPFDAAFRKGIYLIGSYFLPLEAQPGPAKSLLARHFAHAGFCIGMRGQQFDYYEMRV